MALRKPTRELVSALSDEQRLAVLNNDAVKEGGIWANAFV